VGPQTQLTHLYLLDGTHLASIAGGNRYGIAKETTINCVKIFSDDKRDAPTNEEIITGISEVIDAVVRPSVILMAINTDPDDLVDKAVC
jgi:hypothetical protein